MRLRDRPAIGGKSEGTPPAMMPPAEAIAEPGGSNRLFSMETACASQIRPAMMPPAGAIAEPGGSNHLLSNTNAPFAFRALCHLASRLRRCLRREASMWRVAERFACRALYEEPSRSADGSGWRHHRGWCSVNTETRGPLIWTSRFCCFGVNR